MSFARLFPDADYQHHLSVKRGDARRFFAPTSEHEVIVAERARWLKESPYLYAGALESSQSIIEDAVDAMREWGAINQVASEAKDSLGQISALGAKIEPDVVLLEKNPDGVFRVVAGCVCFPSSWAFSEKLGKPLDSVHSVVPNLNSDIGAPISRYLDKIQPGTAWERSNWGLSSSPERNQHPSRNIARLKTPADLNHVWLRVEDQILTILPGTMALLFGIRIVTCRLSDLREEEPVTAAGLHRALATLPEEMARYKNISDVRAELIGLLA